MRGLIVIAWTLVASLLEGGISDHAHPRLWLPAGGESQVQLRIDGDPLAAAMHRMILRNADEILTSRTCRHEIRDGRRLLPESRLALTNIGHCAWAWRFTGREEYRLRAIEEMEAACALKDWNPSHFLDTAEMALAVGWGYDWLFETLTEEQRSRFAKSLVAKALRPADDLYGRNVWWSRPTNNWAQVCGSGIAIAAAVVLEEEPELCARLFDRGVELIGQCHAFYGPDGMYPEGPGYWQYGTMYHVKLLAACEAMGIDFAGEAALQKAGNAIIHLEGPSGYSFNFADSSAKKSVPSAAQCWIAGHFRDGAQSGYLRKGIEAGIRDQGPRFSSYGGPLSLLWLPSVGKAVSLPTSAFFGGVQPVATMRSAWSKQASWIAIKGGLPSVSHGQMDVGSFVFDAEGVRWIHDLGSDSYSLSEYFGSKRWNYFRMQNRSHNTLEIAGKLQNAKAATCPLIRSGSKDGVGHAVFDLSAAYPGVAERVVREVRFEEQTGEVCLIDEIQSPRGEVVWRAITDAEVKIEGDQVVLSKEEKTISIRQESGGGVWSVQNAAPPTPEENQNEGFRTLALRVPARDQLRLEVRITP